ncbi:meiotically up-regulated protein [Metarhizium album ARSEF 1941]|uniref:Meiotically up-regulated protein n=1 Tax=Metarhizium album (strain ARSEF 1941) TaxID=1081103 RepID=A0A0B2WXV4_METAS|nr:meiotically up-regulated protein [Metarhizium album ARSEF 1941]KHO01117.1 meiotically up-regulated protein [Metarhizium album ARSEF 1941]
MGAQQSVPGAQSENSTINSPKTCYYELIGVDTDATDAEIKKAYRRKALELHPDRNLNDVEDATRRFAEIQAAYEVLSDPQERAWYDSHRDSILAGNNFAGDCPEPGVFRNVRLTTTEEILTLIRRFDATIPLNDQPTGFFGVARETFEHLALEEATAAEIGQIDHACYPTFGSSDDEYETVVKHFYASWSGFSTKKSFSWKDKHRLSDAPDRRTRRLMEKENKKSRDDAIREFNDAVRFLVTFVRKRDPRYLQNSQTNAERQRHLRDSAAAQAARSRAANRQKFESYVAPEWSLQQEQVLDDYFSDIEEDSEVEILECVVCSKSFKSAQQLEAHERSRKHVKAVHYLGKQMKKEDIALELDPTMVQETVQETTRNRSVAVPQTTQSVSRPMTEASPPEIGPAMCRPADGLPYQRGHIGVLDSLGDQEADEYAPRDVVEGRVCPSGPEGCAVDNVQRIAEHHLTASIHSISLDETLVSTQDKTGKAKAKRQKKMARHLQEAKAQT